MYVWRFKTVIEGWNFGSWMYFGIKNAYKTVIRTSQKDGELNHVHKVPNNLQHHMRDNGLKYTRAQ